MPRALPPSASPLALGDIACSVAESFTGERARGRFKQDIQQRFKARYCHLASSGRAALSLVLLGLRALEPGQDTVILPAFTSYSVAAAAVRAGLKVRLYDLDPETLAPEPASFAAAISHGALAVVVCHLFGYPCDMARLSQIAAAHGVPLVDDAAQAMGASVDGKPAGMHGVAGIFSLSRGKNLTAVDGGIIVTDNARLHEAIDKLPLARVKAAEHLLIPVKALLLSFLLRPWCYWLPRSIPQLGIGLSTFDADISLAKLSPFQAALGRLMLKKLPSITQGRRKIARAIKAATAKGEVFPSERPDAEPVYLRLPCLNRAGREHPQQGVVRAYPLALCDLEELKPHLVGGQSDFPAARKLAQELLTAPTHCYVSEADIRTIAKGIA